MTIPARRPRRLRAALALTCAAALLFGGCDKLKELRGDGKKKKKKDPPVPVQVHTVESSSIARTLRYNADIRAEQQVRVFSMVPERIVSLRFKEGERVKKGQVLAVVRPDTLRHGERSATAALDAARADRDYLKSEITRQQKLLSKKIVSQAMVDQLRARLRTAEAQLRRLEAVASQASTARGNATIRSPMEGIIGRRFLSQGDMAAPSLPLCTVVRMDRVELEVNVPEQDLANIRAGMAAVVRVARYPGEAFRGPVTRISPTIDLQTRTARVKVVLDNKDHRLMPGMLARVNLEVERRDQVVVVPYNSLIIEMGQGGKAVHRIYVQDPGGKAIGRKVELGIVDAHRVQVVKGLAPGDTLVTRGQHMLRDGRELEVVERLDAAWKVVPAKKTAPVKKQAGDPKPAGGGA